MAALEASDLHITIGAPPMVRVHGDVTPLPYGPLDANSTKQLCYAVLTEQQKKKFEEESELDFSFSVAGLSRFRGNLFVQRGAVGGVFRAIPHTAPPLAKLGVPPAVQNLIKLPRGLVLVTGPTGSGSCAISRALPHARRQAGRRRHAPGLLFVLAR
jgi:twitching motility protein PilT